MAKDTYYFKHDCNARNDIKLVRVRRKYKMAGYGVFFAIIEMLREQSDHKFKISDIEDIAFDLDENIKLIHAIVHDFGLFVIENDEFYSDTLMRRMSDYNDQKAKRIEAGKQGAKSRWAQEEKQTHSKLIAKPKQTHADGIAIDYTTLHYNTLDYTTLQKTKEYTNWAFLTFWEMYGKPVDKKKCLEKFDKLEVWEWEKIFFHVPEYVKSTHDVQYRKNPLTYLHGKCWNDGVVRTNHNTSQIEFSLTPDLNN